MVLSVVISTLSVLVGVSVSTFAIIKYYKSKEEENNK